MSSVMLETNKDVKRLVPVNGQATSSASSGQNGREHQTRRSMPRREHVSRTLRRRRAERILETNIQFVPNPLFEDLNAAEQILAPLPRADGAFLSRHSPASSKTSLEGAPPYLAGLYEIPLLTPQQEVHLFRKMNYLNYRAAVLRDELDREKIPAACLDDIESHLERALSVRNKIVQANLRLVVSIAKRFVDSSNGFDDLVSDGNVPLIRAVEFFDYSRGYRFSTYATWAIRNNFVRLAPRSRKHKARNLTGTQDAFVDHADPRPSRHECETDREVMRAAIDRMLSTLDHRESAILKWRFGLDDSGRPRKYREISNKLNISTERVRQLVVRSLAKLRKFADEQGLEGSDYC